jgi:hypothetical protein
MNYNFERYPSKKSLERGKCFSTHVRFSKSQMYISTKLLKQQAGNQTGLISPEEITKKKEWTFDLLVDKEKRVFAVKFHDKGTFCLRTEPGQVGVGTFVSQFKPVRNKRIYMRYDGKETAWIGSLDGKAVRDESKKVSM